MEASEMFRCENCSKGLIIPRYRKALPPKYKCNACGHCHQPRIRTTKYQPPRKPTIGEQLEQEIAHLLALPEPDRVVVTGEVSMLDPVACTQAAPTLWQKFVAWLSGLKR